METYLEFLRSKIVLASETGFTLPPEEINPALKPHQRDAVLWALEAVKAGRKGLACELNNGYFRDAVGYLQEFEREDMNISLFDLMGEVSG